MNPNSAAILQFQNTDRDNIKTQMGVRSLIFTAQSTVVDAPYITDRIFDFTEAFSLEGISANKFRVTSGAGVQRDREGQKAHARIRTQLG